MLEGTTTRHGIIYEVRGIAGVSKEELESARGYTRCYERPIEATHIAIVITPLANVKGFGIQKFRIERGCISYIIIL